MVSFQESSNESSNDDDIEENYLDTVAGNIHMFLKALILL